MSRRTRLELGTKPRTLYAVRRLTPEERAAATQPSPDVPRPRHRADCAGGERPCPFVSCKHHLYLDVTDAGGVKLNFPDRDVDELEDTCSLDVAERGGITLDETGKLLNLTRERVRQIEVRALVRFRGRGVQ